jgi:hypothetical protein
MTSHEELVQALNQLTSNVMKGLSTHVTTITEDKTEDHTTTLTKIAKVLPKIAHTISQLKLMQDEIDEKRKREEKKEKYSKADLLIAQRHIAKLLEEYEEQEAKEKAETDID